MIRNLQEVGPSLQKIVTRLMTNQNLLKLLYYTDKDPLNHEDLTPEQIKDEIYDKFIKIVPRIGPKETANSLIALRVVDGQKTKENGEFLSISISVEVFVPLTQWAIKNSNLRPFAIMGEVQNSLNNKIIDGMGKMIGGDFQLNFLTEEISCYEMEFFITVYD